MQKKYKKSTIKKPLSLSGFFVAGPRIENGNAIIVPLWLRTWDLMIHNQTKTTLVEWFLCSGTQD